MTKRVVSVVGSPKLEIVGERSIMDRLQVIPQIKHIDTMPVGARQDTDDLGRLHPGMNRAGVLHDQQEIDPLARQLDLKPLQ